ncbi:MAG: YIP1 family protein [Bacillaceae bacterium]|nr:YIP1 family protein [Bacillaceae bacterium]
MSVVNETEMKQGNPQLEKPSIFGMIVSPTEQFGKLKHNPKILVPLTVISIISLVSALILTFGMDMEQLLGEGYEELVGPEESVFIIMVARIFSSIFGLILPAISTVIAALIFLFISKFTDSEVTFKQLFSMSIFVYLISSLGSLFHSVAVVTIDIDSLVPLTSLQFLLGAEGIPAIILTIIEVFTIWHILLFAIGLKIVANFKSGLAWTMTIVYYIVIPVLFGIAAYAIF